MPQTEEAVKAKVTNFYKAFSMPQCLEAVDGTHIAIKQPSVNSRLHKPKGLSFLECAGLL